MTTQACAAVCSHHMVHTVWFERLVYWKWTGKFLCLYHTEKSYLSFILNEIQILNYVEIILVIGEKLQSHDNV